MECGNGGCARRLDKNMVVGMVAAVSVSLWALATCTGLRERMTEHIAVCNGMLVAVNPDLAAPQAGSSSGHSSVVTQGRLGTTRSRDAWERSLKPFLQRGLVDPAGLLACRVCVLMDAITLSRGWLQLISVSMHVDDIHSGRRKYFN
jgi:hypothetical protein